VNKSLQNTLIHIYKFE